MKFLQSLVLALSALSLPNSSPTCQISEEGITRGMGPQENLGYQITAKQNADSSFTLTLQGSRPDFQGVLMYVTSTNEQQHLGKFVNIDQPKFKVQDPASCQRQQIQGVPEATISHASPARVPVGATFTVQLTPQEMASGNLKVHAVIASLDAGQQGKAKWQIVTAALNPASTSAPGTPPPPPRPTGQGGVANSPGVRRVIKCVPKNARSPVPPQAPQTSGQGQPQTPQPQTGPQTPGQGQQGANRPHGNHSQGNGQHNHNHGQAKGTNPGTNPGTKAT
jgi:hypothetical protein